MRRMYGQLEKKTCLLVQNKSSCNSQHLFHALVYREKIFSQELVFVANTDLLKQWMVQEGKYPESLSQEPGEIFKEQYPHLKRGLFLR